MMVSEIVLEQCKKIRKYMDTNVMEEIIGSIVGFWQKTEASQLQIQIDLRYCLNQFTVLNEEDRKYPVYIEEIMASCGTYEELQKNILMELEHFIGRKRIDYSIPESKKVIHQVREFLEEHYTSALSYKTLNDKFGYNEKYLSSLYKEEFGISPGSYIIELRVARAKELMKENPYILLKDVATQVGYTDSLYFGRVFKSREGITPSRYQQKIQDEQKK